MTDEYGYRGWMGGDTCGAEDAEERIEIPAVRAGVDEEMAIFWVGLFMVAVTASLVMAIVHDSAPWGFAALGSWVAAALAAVGTRWRVRIDTEGVEFRRWVCGLPVERKRFLLDVEVSRYWVWEQPDYDHGVEIRDPRGGLDDSTGCFGPYRSDGAQAELIAWINAALQKALALSGAREPAIRCARLDGKLDRVHPTKWGRHGEVREARTTGGLTVVGVPVSEGSTVLFNDDRPVRDPRREDTLSGVRLSGEAVLPNGFELRSGVLVSFVGDSIWIHDNGQGRVRCDGLVYYVDDVMFDAEWHPARFTLAEPVVVDGLEIPAESDVSRMVGLHPESYWFHARLAEPVVHDGVTYDRGRSLFFDSSKRFLQPHSPRLLDASFDPELQTAGSTEDWTKEEEEGW